MTSTWKESVAKTRATTSKPGYRKPDLEVIQPEKLISVVEHGMKVLLPRIKALRELLEPLQTGYIRLQGKKHYAELAITEVKFIPEGVTSQSKSYKSPKSVEQRILEMTPEQRKDMLKKLEEADA